jgi:hypothetical protein
MGRPIEAERWADAVDRWQYGDPARPGDPSTEAWSAATRTFLCRHGVEQMRADADEAVRRFAAQSFVTPAPAFLQGIARVLCGDLDGGDASLEDGISVAEEVGAFEDRTGVLLAIAPVCGLSRVVCAAPGVATALGYDVATALEEPGWSLTASRLVTSACGRTGGGASLEAEGERPSRPGCARRVGKCPAEPLLGGRHGDL